MKARTIAKWLGMAGLVFSGTALAQGGQMGGKKSSEQMKACQKQAKFSSAVDQARNIGPQTTVGEVKQIRSNLEKSYKDYSKSAEKVAKPEATNLQASVSKFRKDLNNVKDQSTLEQTRDQIRSDADQVKMANSQLSEKLNCGMGGGGMGGGAMGDGGMGGGGMGGGAMGDGGMGGGGTSGSDQGGMEQGMGDGGMGR